MAQSHKFKSLDDLTAYFPEAPWRASDTKVWILNSKTEKYELVSKGDFVVKIGDRFEVHDTEPDNAKPAEKVEAQKSETSPSTEEAPNASGLSDSGIRGPLTQTSEEIK